MYLYVIKWDVCDKIEVDPASGISAHVVPYTR